MERPNVKDMRRQLAHLEAARLPHLENWIGLSNLMLPRRGLFLSMGLSPSQAQERYKRIVNSTGMDALRVAASGTHHGMCSPNLDWLGLDLEDPGMASWRPAQQWLERMVELYYKLLRDSNFYAVIQSALLDFWGFANCMTLAWPHPRKIVHFELSPPGEWCWATNRFGEVDAVYRKFSMTARQMAAEFGQDKLSDQVRLALEQNPFQGFEVVMVIEPREAGHREGSPFAAEMAHRVTYFEAQPSDDDQCILRQSGAAEMPAAPASWDRVGADPYGEGPAHDARWDVAMLQGIDRDILLAIQTSVRPPMLAPPEMKARLSVLPGSFTGASKTEVEAVRELYQAQLQIAPAQAKLEAVEAKVRRSLYNDVFLVGADQRSGVTAREIAERAGEKMVFLGAAMERIKAMILEPLIDRVFGLIVRAGILPKPPQELLGMRLRVNLKGPLAQAQRAAGLKPNREMKTEVMEMAQFWPEAARLFDPVAYLRRQQEMAGANVELLRSERDMEALAQAEAQERAQAQQLDAARELLAGAGQLANMPLDRPNALSALTGQPAQGAA